MSILFHPLRALPLPSSQCETEWLTTKQCTGENPCQRCVDNGKRCFYSEDQTAAEVLQNLSRPAPAPGSLPATNNGNANGMSNQTLMPPNNRPDRRASDTSNVVPTMEERMTRVEKMLEALMQERGLGFTPCGSIEREPSVGFRSDTAFSMPLLDPALDQMAQQAPGQTQDSSLPDAPAMGLDASVYIRAGNQSVPFPDPTRYQQYVAQFFGDVHLHYPCVDENDFNTRVQQLVTHGATEPTDIRFLALAYVIFACCDVILAKSLVTANGVDKALGWQWYELADSIVDKTLLFSGSDDTTSIRYLLFQVCLCSNAIRLGPTDISRLCISPMLISRLSPMLQSERPVLSHYNRTFINSQHGGRSLTSNRCSGACVFSGTFVCPIMPYHCLVGGLHHCIWMISTLRRLERFGIG
jgi:hypothetical protein